MSAGAGNTAFDMAWSVARGECSAEEVVRRHLDGLAESPDALNSILWYDVEHALSSARRVDAAQARGETLGPLAGVPIVLKDNICTNFGPTTCGSKMLEAFRSQYNAHVVQQLEDAGAVIIGKTNLDEFAMGSSTEHSAWGVTLNPWDTDRVAGGSSGGSAVAIAARKAPVALGSDTGGSIRQPASFCGVVGLKPTYGRVSRYGLVAFGSSLDQIGPLANDVRDTALVLGAISGHDDRDSTSADAPVPDYIAALEKSLSGVRIGMAAQYFADGLDAEVRSAVEAAVGLMERQGAKIVEIDLPHTPYAIASYYIIAAAEASSNLARFDGVHYGYRTPQPKDIIDLYASSRGEGFGAEVKRRIMLGTYALSSGYYDAYYLKALKTRTLIKKDFDDAFCHVDVIASPVSPTTAFRIGGKNEDPLSMYLGDVYTISANLAGICAVSVPCGFDAEGLPIGLQLMGPAFGEAAILAAAHQYQLGTDFHQRTPPCVSTG
jgi:aspartyl-tRNA(Asn)/glutamyl-tRNA(Gln) amidotransferase subunit A